MPGRFSEQRYCAATGHTAGALASCLFLAGAIGLQADPLIGQASPVIPTPTIHLTDGQDRPMTGHMEPAAEAKSRANALYAEALLALDGLNDDPSRVLEELRQVVALDPHFPAAQVKIADLLIQSGQAEAACAELESARATNPGSSEIEAELSYVQKTRGQTEIALRLARDALIRDPEQVMALRTILEIADDQNDLAGGLLHVEDIFKSGGSGAPASAWLALGRRYIELSRGDAKPPTGDVMLRTLLPIYEQAAAKPPPDMETLTLLADTYKELGRQRDALRTLREAAALAPSNVDIILRCVELENDLGWQTDALKDCEAAYALNPELAGLRQMLGQLDLKSGRFEEAQRLLQAALTDTPNDPELTIDLGLACEGLGQQDKAKACFQRVFASGSCVPEAYLKLAVFQLSDKQVKEAGETLAAARARFPKSAKVRLYEAIQSRYAKDYARAMTRLNEVRELAADPEAGAMEPDFYLESTLTMGLAGKKDLIEPMLQEGLARFPDNADLMNELAYFWADAGRHLSEALALSRRASELDPDNGLIADTCGWVYFRLNRTADALPYLQEAALLTNNDPVVLQHLGDTYLKLDRRRDAIATWRRALEQDPGNRDLAARIDAALAQATDAHLRYAPTK
ncbi:MAG: tetratricopeptide repeat protein [Methylacidiphilales bacterium]|nr:tetratricopeptide repeat protein [Candidatus Methylacidiphilales bacterium]